MNPDMQTKLLRFVQDLSFMKVGGSVMEKTDVRIICATNRNPEQEIRAGNFREDLFYRLHVLPLHMPPLRERGDDVVEIARALLKKYAEVEKKNFSGFDREAEAVLRACRWPGNIRQLQNAIRQAVVMQDGETVTAAMLPLTPVPDRRTQPLMAAMVKSVRWPTSSARAAVERAIRLCGGNVPEAAAARLGVFALHPLP